MPIPGPILSLVLGMALVLAALWLGDNVQLLPIDASTNAPIYDELFQVLFTIGAVLFLGVLGLLLFSLIRFRRREGDHGDGVAIEGNLQLEVFWTAVPAIVVLFVGLYSYDIYDRMGGMAPLGHDHGAAHDASGHSEKIWGGIGGGWPPSEGSESSSGPSGAFVSSETPSAADGPVAVEVTAMQFAFIFNYPGPGFVSGELHVPANRPVSLLMNSKDVIHAFWVPEFRIKQDVIPGQPTVVSFTATRPGRYPIVCAELCGPYHGGMRSTVVVEEPEAYDAWLAANAPATLAQAAPALEG
ncbi:cytochrome c oxidase subunit II [Synechococcus sp. RSCCF101]|uniref:cytochrome c oxidase subunit II n=1 Tax=Synechococcus sp. RSCCF101 TaxID=2511069 RepID=UPI001248B716|nr:cytochrome c oxidase subunit II [Synechococcus sp. RSCCF101]QEY30945.1 cytochrome c oxidase subunit II [Synechococcus sp. RSCCF101]